MNKFLEIQLDSVSKKFVAFDSIVSIYIEKYTTNKYLIKIHLVNGDIVDIGPYEKNQQKCVPTLLEWIETSNNNSL